MSATGLMQQRVCLLLLCAALCTGCVSTWHTVQASPEAAMAAHGQGDVLVKARDGSQAVLHQPAVSADSIVGYEDPPWDQGGEATRRAFALAGVKSISVWKRDKTANTVLWVIGATFGALLLLNIVAAPYGGIAGT